MQNNVFDTWDMYVGKVVSVDFDTHELEVFVPKLTPTLNYGFSPTTYSVGLQSEVLKTNTIKCKPTNYNARLPKKGSLVFVYFVDRDIKKTYWDEFDPFGNNEYYEYEKDGEERTIQELHKMFKINESSLTPKIKNIKLGNKSNPIAEIHGYINLSYIRGLSEELDRINKDFDNISNSYSKEF